MTKMVIANDSLGWPHNFIASKILSSFKNHNFIIKMAILIKKFTEKILKKLIKNGHFRLINFL